MPNKDMATLMALANLGAAMALSADATVNGAIIDTKDMSEGLTIGAYLSAWTDGTHTLLIEESEDSGMSGSNVLPAANRVNAAALPALGAAIVAGAAISLVGVISTKRYVRASYVSTGTTVGATGVLFSVAGLEMAPDGYA